MAERDGGDARAAWGGCLSRGAAAEGDGSAAVGRAGAGTGADSADRHVYSRRVEDAAAVDEQLHVTGGSEGAGGSGAVPAEGLSRAGGGGAAEEQMRGSCGAASGGGGAHRAAGGGDHAGAAVP